jgi:AcrR family transcriptional regulator
MRKLGAELEVDPMAVYHHLPSKDALLDAIVEAIMTEIDLTRDRPADPPEERIMVCARAYRDALLAHGNALPIALARRPATPGALRPVELLIGVLRSAGLAPHQAVAGMNAIAAAVRGMVGMVANQGSAPVEPADRSMLDERLPADLFPFLREAICNGKRDLERDFEFGIRALARGLVLPPSGQPR